MRLFVFGRERVHVCYLQLQSARIKFRLAKIEFHKNTIVNTSWRLVTGTSKDLYWIKPCVNFQLRVRFVKYICSFFKLPPVCLFYRPAVQVDIRLRNSSLPYAGRVEIKYKEVWGRVCEDRWDIEIGHVICRQLGYLAAIAVPCCSAFGPGSGPLWLDRVYCTGNESSIADCEHSDWGVASCSYNADASVVCKAANVNTSSKWW